MYAVVLRTVANVLKIVVFGISHRVHAAILKNVVETAVIAVAAALIKYAVMMMVHVDVVSSFRSPTINMKVSCLLNYIEVLYCTGVI